MSRIIIISDVHGNLDALKSVLEEKFDYLIFAGDAVDYGPEPGEVIDMLKENIHKGVMGNHDAANAFSIDCRCSEKYHDISVRSREYFKKFLSKDQLNFLKNLPMFENFHLDHLKFTLVHGSLMDYLYDYVFPELSDNEILEKFKNSDSDFIIFGHTHFPTIKKIKNSLFLNPGSIGQPRDGDTRASYAIIDTLKNESILLRREYPVENTVNKIRALDMEDDLKYSLIKILETGGKF